MRSFFSFLILFFVIASSLLLAEEEVINGIAAIANNDVITFSQIRELVAAQERAASETLQGQALLDKVKELRQAAVKDLIDRSLILQDYKKKEFSIPEYVIDDSIQKIIREEFGGDRTAFVKTLQAQGYSMARFRQVQKDKIIVSAMRSSKIKESYVVSPVKIKAYYEKNQTTYTTPEQVKLRMIVLHESKQNSGGTTSVSKKSMANEIRQKIAEGAEFDRMAQMYSEDSTQDSGGDFGWVEPKTLNDALHKTISSMKAGEVSPVIELDNAFYIIMVEAIKKASSKPLAEVEQEIEQRLMEEEMLKAQERWLKGLREKAYIKIL
ncbi:MAG: peptidylprolyl isomerase [Chthoniobacterales bacterium]|nr:peptidylprolyl isomerase [Chthoniobacterales bacterium]